MSDDGYPQWKAAVAPTNLDGGVLTEEMLRDGFKAIEEATDKFHRDGYEWLFPVWMWHKAGIDVPGEDWQLVAMNDRQMLDAGVYEKFCVFVGKCWETVLKDKS